MKQQRLFEHTGANATGILDDRFDKENPIVHFRGIKYASLPERFAIPVPEVRDMRTRLTATEYG